MEVMEGGEMRFVLARVTFAFKVESMDRGSLAFWKHAYSRTC